MGQYLDQFLHKNVIRTKAYLRDRKNLLQVLQELKLTEQGDIFLVTSDVSSLYTIIQHFDALLALNRDDFTQCQKIFLRDALAFCLSHNYFWFNNHFFPQKKGVAMGVKFAPSIANLFMGEWEDNYVFAKKREELFHKCFIDDLMFIWEGSESPLVEYLAFLNNNSNNIKLTSQWSK